MALDPKLSKLSYPTGKTSKYRIDNQTMSSRGPTRLCYFPLLFNINIDDIEDAIPSELRDQMRVCKHADDCTVFMKIQRGSESKMQAVLDSLQRWADINNMLLNTAKTKDICGFVFYRLALQNQKD